MPFTKASHDLKQPVATHTTANHLSSGFASDRLILNKAFWGQTTTQCYQIQQVPGKSWRWHWKPPALASVRTESPVLVFWVFFKLTAMHTVLTICHCHWSPGCPHSGAWCAASWWLPERVAHLDLCSARRPWQWDALGLSLLSLLPAIWILSQELISFPSIRERREAQRVTASSLGSGLPSLPLGSQLPSSWKTLLRQLCESGEWDGRTTRTLHCLALSCWVCDSSEQSTCTASANGGQWGHPCGPQSRTLEPGHPSEGLLGALSYCGQANHDSDQRLETKFKGLLSYKTHHNQPTITKLNSRVSYSLSCALLGFNSASHCNHTICLGVSEQAKDWSPKSLMPRNVHTSGSTAGGPDVLCEASHLVTIHPPGALPFPCHSPFLLTWST